MLRSLAACYRLLRMQSTLLFTFFYNDTATTETYTLSLHDALPIFAVPGLRGGAGRDDLRRAARGEDRGTDQPGDRKSTRLNSSHRCISYAVFCLKKKNNNKTKGLNG